MPLLMTPMMTTTMMIMTTTRVIMMMTVVGFVQLFPDLFNRAALMNVGFMEARKWTTTTNDDDGINDDDDDDDERPFDCFIFHDIDQLPIDDRNFYVCSGCPRHVVGFRKKFNYGWVLTNTHTQTQTHTHAHTYI